MLGILRSAWHTKAFFLAIGEHIVWIKFPPWLAILLTYQCLLCIIKVVLIFQLQSPLLAVYSFYLTIRLTIRGRSGPIPVLLYVRTYIFVGIDMAKTNWQEKQTQYTTIDTHAAKLLNRKEAAIGVVRIRYYYNWIEYRRSNVYQLLVIREQMWYVIFERSIYT